MNHPRNSQRMQIGPEGMKKQDDMNGDTWVYIYTFNEDEKKIPSFSIETNWRDANIKGLFWFLETTIDWNYKVMVYNRSTKLVRYRKKHLMIQLGMKSKVR